MATIESVENCQFISKFNCEIKCDIEDKEQDGVSFLKLQN